MDCVFQSKIIVTNFCILIVALLSGCGTKKEIPEQNFPIVNLLVLVDNLPCDDCNVTILGGNHKLSKNGTKSFPVLPEVLNTETDAYVYSNKIHDSNFYVERIPVEKDMLITYSVKKLIDDERERLKEDIYNAKLLIKDIRERMIAFQEKYPDSNISEFEPNINNLDADVNSLENSFDKMVKIYTGKKSDARIEDIKFITKQKNEFSKLRDLLSKVQDRVIVVDELERDNENVIEKRFNAINAVYYELGEHKINETEFDNVQLDRIVQEINDYILSIETDSQYKGLKEIYSKIKIIGYTDGVPISKEKCDSLFVQCVIEYELINKKPYVDEFDNGSDRCNLCLSYLRAKRVGEEIINRIGIKSNDIGLDVIAKGSSLARGNEEAKKKLRRCNVNFIINFKELEESSIKP